MSRADTTDDALLARFLRAIEAPESSPSAYLASVIAAGYPVTSELSVAIGRGPTLVSQVVGDMKRAGWRIDTRNPDGSPRQASDARKPAQWQATHGPGGDPVRPKQGPPPRGKWHDEAEHQAARRERDAKREEREARETRKRVGKELAIRPNGKHAGREALLGPVLHAPPVGSVMRAMMVAEDDEGAAIMALRDEHGETHFVRIVEAPATK